MSTITYSDIRNPEAREEFINSAGSPTVCLSAEPLENPITRIEDIVTEMPLPQPLIPIDPQPPREKRSYVKISTDQKRHLTHLYMQYGDTWKAEKYAAVVGIKLGTIRGLIHKLRNNVCILPTVVQRGRMKIITSVEAEKIVQIIEENNQVTLKEISTSMQTLHGKKISESTISRFLSYPQNYGTMIPSFVFKRCSNRPPTANSPENKRLRKEKVIQQINAKRQGKILTFVDESSINLASVRNYGWAPAGVKAFAYRKRRYLNLTAITFISERGVEYCQMIVGSVTADVFEATMKNFLTHCCSDGNPRAFVMDNARIHDPSLDDYVKQFNHNILFNAPNSPEMNPIKMVFGFWKSRCKDILNKETDRETVANRIAEVLTQTPLCEVKRYIEHVFSVVWRKIQNDEDL